MYIYTIIGSEIGYIGGNYKNDKPLLAANKAGKALFKKLEDVKYVKYKNKKSIKFVLKNKKDKKNYCYEVFKKKNKKEFNYEIKECVLSKNQLKKYIGGVGSDSEESSDSEEYIVSQLIREASQSSNPPISGVVYTCPIDGDNYYYSKEFSDTYEFTNNIGFRCVKKNMWEKSPWSKNPAFRSPRPSKKEGNDARKTPQR